MSNAPARNNDFVYSLCNINVFPMLKKQANVLFDFKAEDTRIIWPQILLHFILSAIFYIKVQRQNSCTVAPALNLDKYKASVPVTGSLPRHHSTINI